MRSPSFLCAIFSILCFTLWQNFGIWAKPVGLSSRQQNIVFTNIGLNGAIYGDLEGLVEDPSNAPAWMKKLTNDFEQQVDVIEELKPAAGAPAQKDIVDIVIHVVLTIANDMIDLPITALVQLPFLDTILAKWCKAWDTPYPGTTEDAGYGIADQYPQYVHLLTLNLTITLDILGLGNKLEDLGL